MQAVPENAGDEGRLLLDLAKREADQLVAMPAKAEPAGAIVLKGLAAAMGLPAVGLHGEALLAREEIDEVRADPDVDRRDRQFVAAAESEEHPLELAAGPVRVHVVERKAVKFRLADG